MVLETEKATIEVPSPVSGIIKELHVQEGRKVRVGDLLFTVEENGGAAKQREKPQRETQVQRPRAEEQAAASPPSRGAGSAQATGAAVGQATKVGAAKKPEGRAEPASESKAAPKSEPEPGKREPPRVEE